ncbi:hypothetical protein [Vibrio mediterranei]|uniref:hypothetical protein n=1 Tax=Vibrio mediterranei TaxID=689 RepID=UPI004068238B
MSSHYEDIEHLSEAVDQLKANRDDATDLLAKALIGAIKEGDKKGILQLLGTISPLEVNAISVSDLLVKVRENI